MADQRLLSLYNKYLQSDSAGDSTQRNSAPNTLENVTYNYSETQANHIINETQEDEETSMNTSKGKNYENADSDISLTEDTQPITCRQRTPNNTINQNFDPITTSPKLNTYTDAFNLNTQNDPILQNLRDMDKNTTYISQLNQAKPSSSAPSQALSNRVILPTNNTVQSMGKGTVVLVKFQKQDTKNLLSNPILINKLIMNSDFNILRIKDIRKNIHRNLIAVEAENKLNSEEIQKLTSISKLGSYEVECELPNLDKFKTGVVYPISENIDLDELKQQINIDNDIQIVKLERLRKKINNNWTNTQSVKITFSNEHLPDHIIISYMKYKIRPFINDPMQCFRCQRLGHTSTSCKSKLPRCMICSGPHNKDQCESGKINCANCGGEHTANSKQCDIMKQAHKIEKLRASYSNDHSTFQNRVNNPIFSSQTSRFPPLISQIPDTPPEDNTIISYASIAKRRNEYHPMIKKRPNTLNEHQYHQNTRIKIVKDAETQTEEKLAEKKNEEFLIQLRNFILDIMSCNLNKESEQAKICLADNAIKNNFGIDIRHTETDEATGNAADLRKRKRHQQDNGNIDDNDTEETEFAEESELTEDVVSGEETIWETVEKKAN